MSTETNVDELLTTKGACQLLRCGRDTVYKLAGEGMPHMRVGLGTIRAPFIFHRSEILRWLKDRTDAMASTP